jgi:hypothetical protein
MSTRSTEEVVAQLVDGVEPVRRIAAMRWQLLRVAGIWTATAALAAFWIGIHPLAVFERGARSAGIEIALLSIGFAGLTIALAARIPGRERLAIGASAGIALGLGIIGAAAAGLSGLDARSGFRCQCIGCGGRSLLLAIPTGLLAMRLALQGAGWRPALTGFGIAIGAVALGALLVHVSCPSPDPWHWLLAHVRLPLLAGIPIGTLAAWAFGRAAKRSARATRRRLAR